MEKMPWQKILLNQESSLTDVWLKHDPPVPVASNDQKVMFYFISIVLT